MRPKSEDFLPSIIRNIITCNCKAEMPCNRKHCGCVINSSVCTNLCECNLEMCTNRDEEINFECEDDGCRDIEEDDEEEL